jgi:hypothetical protein
MADMADLADVANMANMAVTAEKVTAGEVTRCPRCGMIAGGTAAALDALYGEVARLRQVAERPLADERAAERADENHALALQAAAAREAELLREIRLLQETVARLRGKIVI